MAPSFPESAISLVSLTGGVSAYIGSTGIYGPQNNAHLIPTPLRVSSPELAEMLRVEPYVRHVLDMALTAKLALVGVGSVARSATLVRYGYCTWAEIELFARRGAVGDLLGHFYDRNGEILDLDLHRHVVAVTPEDMRKIPAVAAVAAGPEKVEAILGLLRGRLANILVTDEPTARELLGREKMTTHLLVLDAGTGSARAVIFDRHGRQVGLAQEEWTHLPEAGVPGSMGFDVAGGWALIKRCIGKALATCGLTGADIAAISSTSMREAIVLYDGDRREVWACANVDSRASAEVAELKARSPSFEREFYEVSGETFALGALPRLNWLAQTPPEFFERVRHISMINDWIGARLTGEIAVEPTNCSTNGLMDLAARDWSGVLIAKAGLDRRCFRAWSSRARSSARSPGPRPGKPGSLPARPSSPAAATCNLARSGSACSASPTQRCSAAPSGSRS